MRRAEGDSRTVNDTLQTINAAATAIAEAENRVTQATVQKRRWRNFWSLYWCFGSHKHTKRIGHAVIVQETTAPGISTADSENSTQTPTFSLPFIAPPSSPASFLQSEPPSVTQSPAGSVSNIYMSVNMYSPSGPASIFAIGPYAYETQLVSPPVFSAFPTEPSTAPFTPPPESVHLTTPSSPEVPFAQQLDPHFRNGEVGQRFPIFHYEFQSYHLHPGSPVGQLISPRSAISGSGPSSPFPDGEFASSGSLNFLDFRMGDPPKLDNLDKISYGKWGLHQNCEQRSHHGTTGVVTPDSVKSTPRKGFLRDNRQVKITSSPQHINLGCRDDEQTIGGDRVSFDLASEAGSVSRLNGRTTRTQEKLNEVVENGECCLGETSANELEKAATSDVEKTNQHHDQGSITLGSNKEFHFDSVEGNGSNKPINGADWWANEKVVGKEVEESGDWSFFPVMQTGVR